MTTKTLREAAMDVLNASLAKAPKEGMHSFKDMGPQPAGTIVDLGGATIENPQGNEIGKVAANARGSANPPGVKPDASSKEGMKKLPTQPGETAGSPHTSPDEEDGAHPATGGALTSTSYAHPTSGGTVSEEVDEDENEEPTAEEIEEAHKARVEKVKDAMKKKMCVKEDIDAIFSGETLSEEFRTKVATIFEAAVVNRAVEVLEIAEQEILEAAEETVEEIKEELEGQVDSYLDLLVDQWKEENAVAIENGLRTEIAEEFMAGLKTLFEEHNITVPDEKVDVLESLASEVDELKEQLNNALNVNVELSQRITESKKTEVLSKVCEGLTATQTEKIRTLAEGVEFSTEADYQKKLQALVESYCKSTGVKANATSKSIALTESSGEVPTDPAAKNTKNVDPFVAAVAATLSRTTQR